MLRGISKLAPGHDLVAKNGKTEIMPILGS